MIKWKITKLALSNLERLLTCSLCNRLVQDPCTLEACDHHFCRNCVENVVGVESKCPECGAFAWSKDLKVNRRLADILSLCKSIRSTIGNDDNADETATPRQETCKADVLLRPMSTSTEDNEIAESNEIRLSAQGGDGILLKHSWNPRKRREEPESNTDNNRNQEREEYDAHSEAGCSQESETEDVNSSLELFSSNNSFCNENDLTQSETPSSNAHCGESDNMTSTADEDINASFDSHENNSEISRICDSRPKPHTHVNADTQEIVQVKGKKRKMSDSDSEIDDRGSTSTLQEQVFMIEKNTPDTEKTIHSQRDSEMEFSSKKKRNRLVSSDKNTGKTNQLTPKSSIRKKLITSPASVKSIMELSPTQLAKRNKRGEGLLHVAAIKDNDEDARYLLKKGADPNARDNAGWSPLHEACNHGHIRIAELLLDNGAIVNLPGGPEHETPLHDAVANGRLQVASLLIKRGASLHARNNQGLTPIDYAFTDPMRRLLEEESSAQCQAWTSDKENILLQTNMPQEQHTAKVLLYTGLNTEQKEKLELCAAILGAKVVNEFSIDVTHIITSTNSSSLCRRTMKYLSGILCGKWIVSFGWITKCLSANKWVDESPFEVKGTSNARSGIPHHARLNHLQQLPGLFDGCKFFFSGTFDPKTPIKEDLINLVNYGGGKVLTREPKQDIDYSPFLVQSKYHKDTIPASMISTVAYHAQPDSTQYRCTTYIIYDPLSQNKQSVRNVSGPSVAPVGWLLDCISNFEIIDIEMFLCK